MMFRTIRVGVVVAILAGCAPEDIYVTSPRVDAGRADAGRPDAGRPDAGRADGGDGVDAAGASDVGPAGDAGSPDVGVATDVSPVPDVPEPVDVGPPPCADEDMDGISDQIEGRPDLRTSMRAGLPPDFLNPDSDDDGVSDEAEGRRSYAGFETLSRSPLTCGDYPDDCDGDGLPNHRDRDSDNDGLTDHEEAATLRSNPCALDTDGDGVSDLIEAAAMSSPTDPTSRPRSGSIYVTLPFMDRAGPQSQEFSFRTRIRNADIMFLVDTTGSMGGTITAVRSTLSSAIVPGIVRAFGAGADVRYGMAEHRDFSNGGGDFALRVLQRLDADATRSQTATSGMAASGGGDGPEAQVPALHALVSGFGQAAYGGTATRRVTAADCGGDASAYGWGCFREGRVPILVLFSDAEWHNGPSMPTGNFYSAASGTPTYNALVAELTRREAYFVGIDVGGGSTNSASLQLARATRTLDGSGNPIAFRGAPATVAANVISAITTLATGTRQDVTRRVVGDAMETRLPAGRSTAEFFRSITPVRGSPGAPAGFSRMDSSTFYDVAPATIVVFEATLFNDFYRNLSGAAQLFQATIEVLGRAGSVLDTVPVYIVVPTDPNSIPG